MSYLKYKKRYNNLYFYYYICIDIRRRFLDDEGIKVKTLFVSKIVNVIYEGDRVKLIFSPGFVGFSKMGKGQTFSTGFRGRRV